jgi:superfamily I DNA/RNA helicase
MVERPAAAKSRFSKKRWSKLSDQQQAVIKWVLDDTGNLELMARAGCGKTFTLMQVVEAIVEFNLGDVALMAFNKSIAGEIKAKLEAAKYDWRIAQAGTSHSFGFNVWRKAAPNAKLVDDKVIRIIRSFADTHHKSPNIWVDCMGVIDRLVSLGKQRAIGHLCHLEDPNVWMDIWDHHDLDNDTTENYSPDEIIQCAKKVYKISLDQCRETIDFDDMILAPLYFRAKFWPKDWILIDESQDTNPARRALALAMLKPRTGRLIFVGDDKQAINGFAGADNDAMEQIKKQTNAKTLVLNVTRRCPKAVVEEAKKLVPDFVAYKDNPEGKVRTLEYENLHLEKLTKTDAILCRNTAPLVQTAYMLLAKGVPCRVEGREIGQGLIKLARRWKLTQLSDLLDKLQDYEERETAKHMSKNRQDLVDKLVDQVECLRVIINRQLTLKKYTIDEMVNDINVMFGNTKEGTPPEVLVLSTVHKSKGREWKRVYILGRQRFMPSPYAKKDWQLEQERNLEYVAITRAIEEMIDVPYNADKK